MSKRKVYLCCVGIDKYDDFRTLTCCSTDARRFREAFIEKANVTRDWLMVSDGDPAAKPDCDTVTTALRSLAKLSLGEDDLVVFYFAGHGVSFEGKDHLILSDSKRNRYSGSMPTDDLMAALRKTCAGTCVLIVDACRVQVERALSVFGEFTAELARRQGVIVFFGCSPGETCQELAGLGDGHGIFTYALIHAINGDAPATPISIDRLVFEEVKSLCAANKLSDQRPYTTVSPIQKALIDLFTGQVVGAELGHEQKCILIVGPSNAGKTTLGQYLASELGFLHVEMSSFAWKRFADRPKSYRKTIQDYIEEIVWEKKRFDAIAQDLLAAHKGIGGMVVCGARRTEEVETLQSAEWDVLPIYLFAHAGVRFERHQQGAEVSRYDLGYDDFVKKDLREYGWGLAKAASMKGFELITNEESIDAMCQDGLACIRGS